MKGRIYKDYSTPCDCAQELKTKDCGNCEHCFELCAGDIVCELELKAGVRELMLDNYERTEHYFYCHGRKWKG